MSSLSYDHDIAWSSLISIISRSAEFLRLTSWRSYLFQLNDHVYLAYTTSITSFQLFLATRAVHLRRRSAMYHCRRFTALAMRASSGLCPSMYLKVYIYMSIVMFPHLLSPSIPPTPSTLSYTLLQSAIPHLISTTSLNLRVLKLSAHLTTSCHLRLLPLLRQLSTTSRSLLKNPNLAPLFHCPDMSRSVFGAFAVPSSQRSRLRRTPSLFSRDALAKALSGRIIARRSTRKISCLVANTAVSLPEKVFSQEGTLIGH